MRCSVELPSAVAKIIIGTCTVCIGWSLPTSRFGLRWAYRGARADGVTIVYVVCDQVLEFADQEDVCVLSNESSASYFPAL